MKRPLIILLIALITAGAWEVSARSRRVRFYVQRQRQQEDCSKSLRSLYNFLQNYANACQGRLPAKNNFAGLRELIRFGATELNFQCPEFNGKKRRDINDLTEKQIPFIYFGGANLFIARPNCPKLPLICDKPGGKHLNILFMDGSVAELDQHKIKVKISNCRTLVEALNEIYDYPPALLKTLRTSAKSMDKELNMIKK